MIAVGVEEGVKLHDFTSLSPIMSIATTVEPSEPFVTFSEVKKMIDNAINNAMLRRIDDIVAARLQTMLPQLSRKIVAEEFKKQQQQQHQQHEPQRKQEQQRQQLQQRQQEDESFLTHSVTFMENCHKEVSNDFEYCDAENDNDKSIVDSLKQDLMSISDSIDKLEDDFMCDKGRLFGYMEDENASITPVNSYNSRQSKYVHLKNESKIDSADEASDNIQLQNLLALESRNDSVNSNAYITNTLNRSEIETDMNSLSEAKEDSDRDESRPGQFLKDGDDDDGGVITGVIPAMIMRKIDDLKIDLERTARDLETLRTRELEAITANMNQIERRFQEMTVIKQTPTTASLDTLLTHCVITPNPSRFHFQTVRVVQTKLNVVLGRYGNDVFEY